MAQLEAPFCEAANLSRNFIKDFDYSAIWL